MTTPKRDPSLVAEAQQMIAQAKAESTRHWLEDIRKVVQFVQERPANDG